MITRFLTFSLLALGMANGQDRAAVEPKTLPAPEQIVEVIEKPKVEKLDDTHYRIGKITIDKTKREIRIPAVVNMRDDLLEFLLVHQNGKTHESLFATDASPTHINLAFKLLRFPASREMHSLRDEKDRITDKHPEVSPEVKSAARVAIRAEWQQDGETKSFPATDLIQHKVKTTAMPAGPWVYGESNIDPSGYAPETSGDIIDIYTAESAILNYPGDGHDDDTIWLPFAKRLPPVGTPVTLIITPWPAGETPSQP